MLRQDGSKMSLGEFLSSFIFLRLQFTGEYSQCSVAGTFMQDWNGDTSELQCLKGN